MAYYDFNEITVEFFHNIDDLLWEDEKAFICLEHFDDEKNLFKLLKECKHPFLVAALLKACRFDGNFVVNKFPHWEYFLEFCWKYEESCPKVLKLMGDISMYDCRGIQFAEYNIETCELTYTHYSVRALGMYNAVKGKGKVPLSLNGSLVWEKHIPM